LSDVQWVSAADNYLALHLPPQQYLERGTLGAALARPAWAGLFLSVHRSHAVNPQHVMACQPLPSGEAVLTLRCGQELRVSRAHRELVRQLAPAR
jgi:DNA-binding LytR/AlgR family response regulator